MFRTLIRILDAVATTADAIGAKLEELEERWQERKPQLEDAVIDLSLDLEEGLRATGEALSWTASGMARGTARTAVKALYLAGRAYRAVRRGAGIALPILRKSAGRALLGLYGGLREAHSRLAPIRREATCRIASAWAFRADLLREAGA